jgi:hypothetical protein
MPLQIASAAHSESFSASSADMLSCVFFAAIKDNQCRLEKYFPMNNLNKNREISSAPYRVPSARIGLSLPRVAIHTPKRTKRLRFPHIVSFSLTRGEALQYTS